MKKIISLILVSALAALLCISVCADDQKIFGDVTTTPKYGTNIKRVSDIAATEGYTVYPIISNKNVTFYSVKDGKETAAKYKEPTVTPKGGTDLIAQEALAADNAVRAFCAPPYANLNGYQCMLGKAGIVEIKFHGTAINLGLTRLPNMTESPGMSAKITIDGKEFKTTAGIFVPEVADEAHRQVDKRFFTSEELEDGWHTVRIYSTSTEGSNSPQGTVYLDFFEIKETKGEAPATSDVTLGIAATAVCLSVIALGAAAKRRNGR